MSFVGDAKMAIETVLYNLVSDNPKSEHIMDMIRHLHTNGGFDPCAKVNDGGFPFILAWMRRDNVSLSLGIDGIDFLDDISNGKIWSVSDMHNRTLFDFAMSKINDRDKPYSYEDDVLEHILRKIPKIPRTFRHINGHEEINVFSKIVSGGFDKSALALMERTKKRLDSRQENDDNPIAAKINSVEMWEEFLRQNGDPRQEITHREKRIALWMKLRDAKDDKLSEAVRDWASKNASDEQQDIEDAEYWRALNSAYEGSEIAKKMKARAGWESKRDANGRNPMMVSLLRNPVSFSGFSGLAKVKPHLNDIDNDGLSLWFYAALKTSKAPEGIFKWLSSNVNPAFDKDGRGLFQQVIRHCKKNGESEHQAFKIGWENKKLQQSEFISAVAKHPGFLWGGTRRTMDECANWMCTEMYRGKARKPTSATGFVRETSKMLEATFEDFMASQPTPKFMGAMVVAMVLNYEGGKDIVDKLIEAGATLDFDFNESSDSNSPLKEFFEARLSEERRQSIISRCESNKLKGGMPCHDTKKRQKNAGAV